MIESDAHQTVPRTMAFTLANETYEVVKAKVDKKIELKDLKKAIKEFDKWPFERARVR